MPSKSLVSKVKSKINSTSGSNNLSYNCQIGSGIVVVGLIIGISINILIIVSLSNIEKLSNCDCSKLPYKDYVKEWFTFLIFYQIVMALAFILGSFECWELFIQYPPMNIINIVVSLITLIMMIKLFLYLREIRKNCNCAYGNKETFLYWFYLIYFSIILSIITLIIVLLVISAILYLFR